MWLSIALLQILTLFQNCLEMLFRTANEHQLMLSTGASGFIWKDGQVPQVQ